MTLAVLGIGSPALAQVLSSARGADWTKAGVSGGIPTRTIICATLNPGASAAQIGSALQSCPAGQVVKLNAGTYTIGGIDFGGAKQNVTLGGAGANQSFLIFNASTSCNSMTSDVCMGGSDNNWPGGPTNSASWTAG